VRLDEKCVDPIRDCHKRSKGQHGSSEALRVAPIIIPLMAPPFPLSPHRPVSPLESFVPAADSLVSSVDSVDSLVSSVESLVVDLPASDDVPIPILLPAPDISFPGGILQPFGDAVRSSPRANDALSLSSDIILFKKPSSPREFIVKESYDTTYVNQLRDNNRDSVKDKSFAPFNKDADLEKLVLKLLKSHKKLQIDVQNLTKEVGGLKNELTLAKSTSGSKAVWGLPDFRLVECSQSFLDLFGWKSIPHVFFLNNLLRVEIPEMFKHCGVLREFLDNPYGVLSRNITKRFKRCDTGEFFKCAVILTLDLKKNIFVTVLHKL